MNGVRSDFNGIGVFIYKSHTRKPGQWVRKNVFNTCLVRDHDPQ